ncbi:MAG: hypothetical protein ACFFCM_17950, partial [Promethearchaeota archaeon]
KKKGLVLFFIINSILISTLIISNYSATSNSTTFWTGYHKIRIFIKESFKTWNSDGIAICSYNENQKNPQICSDSAGGAIIVWEDLRSGPSHIYAQRINSTGGVEWTTNGTIICTYSSNQDYPDICSDGDGGAIIAWRDDRSVPNDIYAQRINSSGGLEWNTSGVVICNETGNKDPPKICSDLAGGAIIVWTDYRNGISWDIYGQRINSDGIVQWTPNGVEVCTANQTQYQLQICSDNTSGAIIAWEDYRGIDCDIYAQRINSSGGIEWADNGTVICAENDDQTYTQICSDGEGGAIITWQDKRLVTVIDIYAQKINSSGVLKWSSTGHSVCQASNNQFFPQLCSDGSGGAIITWQDFRNGSVYEIYAQRVKSGGGLLWTTNGVAICTAYSNQERPQICSDGAGGAIITWQDVRIGINYDIYAQKIDSGGRIENPDGIAICKGDDDQKDPQLCSDDNGGAIITWEDYRSESHYDIYAQRLIKTTPDKSLDLFILLLASQKPPSNKFLLPLIIGSTVAIVIILIVIISKKRK